MDGFIMRYVAFVGLNFAQMERGRELVLYEARINVVIWN